MSVNTNNKRVFQTIDLKEIFGKDVRDKNLKEKIGQYFIDKMKSRTRSGIDINGDKFAPYSESYKNSIPFQAAGKSKHVNLKLSGDMLGSIDIVKVEGNKIRIGFDDREQELKAHGHMTGGGNGNKLPIREFFGVSESEIQDAKDKFGRLVDGDKKK